MPQKQLFYTASDGTKLRSPKYWSMFLKSLKVALDNTSFAINLIYDGADPLVDVPLAVNVIRYQHRLFNQFAASPNNSHQAWLDTCRSTYLKTEISHIANAMGINGNVLYTDIDCFILKDFSINYTGKPFWAGSHVKNRHEHLCPGVLIINVNRMLAFDDVMLSHIATNMATNKAYDFDDFNAIFKLGSYGLLPSEYNWKPVWGINDNVKVLHFSGAKPNSIEEPWRLSHIKHLKDPNPAAFEHYSAWFESL